jgi:hypothetical protein
MGSAAGSAPSPQITSNTKTMEADTTHRWNDDGYGWKHNQTFGDLVLHELEQAVIQVCEAASEPHAVWSPSELRRLDAILDYFSVLRDTAHATIKHKDRKVEIAPPQP